MNYLSNQQKRPLDNLLTKPRQFHFIGVGGIGMSALALILIDRGYSVSGSDIKTNSSLVKLKEKGAIIFESQSTNNIDLICKGGISPIIIISSAIESSNPELNAAKEKKLEINHRSELLAALLKINTSIAVAGSHGKTTSSTLITTILAKSNYDPTAIVGGIVPIYNSNGHSGKGDFIIAEADESDGSLTKLKPNLGIITNIELDHTDYYQNIESLISTMKVFCSNCKEVLANSDCKIVNLNIEATYWWSNEQTQNIDFACIPVSINGNETIANYYEKGLYIDKIKLPLPGMHNLSNATCAIASCRINGIPFDEIKISIPHLKAPKRRFELLGIWQRRLFIDDYAHHPSEVEATLKIANLMIKTKSSPFKESPKRIFTIFQPHRYTRTKEFIKEFAIALAKTNIIILAPIYSAGEKPLVGVNNKILAKAIKIHNKNAAVYISESLENIIELIKEKSTEGDLILLMGAGNINLIWGKFDKDSNPISL